LALLRAIRDGHIRADAAVMIGNRPSCRGIAEQFGVPWFDVGDAHGVPDDARLVELLDEHEVDYVVLARYMRVLPAATCWKFAGGRIINLHHGLLPSFPGLRPYQDAYAGRMLTYGATCHFIVPDLDAGNHPPKAISKTGVEGTGGLYSRSWTVMNETSPTRKSVVVTVSWENNRHQVSIASIKNQVAW
jgi:formyltetrahydrofolate deformylase